MRNVHAAQLIAQHGRNAIYLMPTNLYGPGDKFHPAVSHVIPALIKTIVDAKESGADHIEVWGTGSASREFLYVDDAAEGVLLAAEHYDEGEPVNLGSNSELFIKDLVPTLCEILGYEGEVRWDTTKPDGQPRRAVDGDRAESSFGFKAATPFDEATTHGPTGTGEPRRGRSLATAAGPGRRGSIRQRTRPSRSGLGAQPSARCEVRSGRRCLGSSTGRSSCTISDDEPVLEHQLGRSAVNSPSLPMLIGPISLESSRARSRALRR